MDLWFHLWIKQKNEKRGKMKKEQKLSGENTPKSEIGKISYQNWKSEPKNSPKAFGELIT